MGLKLYPHQEEALDRLRSGSILYGGVGSGKTLTALAFYKQYYSNKSLIVITTAKKRNDGDWEEEAALSGINRLVVDSWNNIDNYLGIHNAFFIFDEQRVVGNGKWAKTFVKIAKTNAWILLTGTPGDKWEDYIPVFLANGFYKNKTEFGNMHLEYSRFTKFPQVIRYHNEGLLEKNRNSVLVHMEFERHTVRHHKTIWVDYDIEGYKHILKDRWNVYEDRPIRNISECRSVLRRLVNTHMSRIDVTRILLDIHEKLIVFYNFDYERRILLDLCDEIKRPVHQYNGHCHDPMPTDEEWIYIVQYTAGAEGWNCITTDTILFYSLNDSWKITEQSEGRIDRMNTPFTDLNYIYLRSKAKLDLDIKRTLDNKKKFNMNAWLRKQGVIFE